MAQNPLTGEGFDAVEVGSDDYFDANANDPAFPGVLGLQMRVHHFWQGDVAFDTYETLGPVMGEGPNASIVVAGPGGSTPLGLAAGFGPNGENPSTWDPSNPDSAVPGGFVVSAPPFAPLIGQSEHLIVIELHGAYGFPSGVCKFPITPEEPGADFPSNSHWYPDMVGFGEIVVPGYEKLETIGWQSFWPNSDGYDDYCCISVDELNTQGDPHDQHGPIANLIWTKRFATVCRLVVGNSLFNDDVIITDFSYSDVFGDPNSVKYKITFKRFRTTSIFSVSNPSADVDHFSNIPSNNGIGQTFTQETTENANGDGTTSNSLVDPSQPDTTQVTSPITPSTVFPDESQARQAQNAGQVQNPIVTYTVYALSDDRAHNGGGIFHIFDQDKGETLSDVAFRAGVEWNGVQIDLNPQYKYTDPNTVNLSPGAKIQIALGHPAIDATSNNPFNAPSQLVDRNYFDPNR